MRRLLLLPWLLLPTASSLANEEDLVALMEFYPSGRHLIEVTYTSLDTVLGDSDVYVAGYTLAYSNQLRFSAAAAFTELDPEPPAGSASGLGDARFLLQYDPSANLTANAFIPENLGLTFALQAPTGDHEEGLGEDLWAAAIGAGWLVDFPLDFWLLPALSYERTFDEGPEALRRERADLSLGLYWLFTHRYWLGIEPILAYDFVADDEAIDWSVVGGKVFASGFGIDLGWSRTDRLQPRGVRDDEILTLNLSYQFGRPPRTAD